MKAPLQRLLGLFKAHESQQTDDPMAALMRRYGEARHRLAIAEMHEHMRRSGELPASATRLSDHDRPR